MKLTIEEIAPYLPYGLKGNYQLSDVVPDAKSELRNKELRSDNVDFFIQYATPILRKLDLTIPVTIDSVEIVPIVELAKIALPGDEWKINSYGACFNGEDIFGHNKNNFYCTDVENLCSVHIFNQLQLFQWLFKNKFDVFGLIDKGLAIDASTLQENPYNQQQ